MKRFLIIASAIVAMLIAICLFQNLDLLAIRDIKIGDTKSEVESKLPPQKDAFMRSEGMKAGPASGSLAQSHVVFVHQDYNFHLLVFHVRAFTLEYSFDKLEKIEWRF